MPPVLEGDLHGASELGVQIHGFPACPPVTRACDAISLTIALALAPCSLIHRAREQARSAWADVRAERASPPTSVPRRSTISSTNPRHTLVKLLTKLSGFLIS